jgi:hypothetical protein
VKVDDPHTFSRVVLKSMYESNVPKYCEVNEISSNSEIIRKHESLRISLFVSSRCYKIVSNFFEIEF